MARHSTDDNQTEKTKARIELFDAQATNNNTSKSLKLGFENWTSREAVRDSSRDALETTVAQIYGSSNDTGFGTDLSKAQMQAAATILGIGSLGFEAISNYHNAAIANVGQAREGVRDSAQIGYGRHGTSSLGLEYFNNEVNLDKHVGASVEFNLQAARQNDEWEHMFPTVSLDPSDIGMEVDINILYVHQQVRHAMNKKDNAPFVRRNVLDAVSDPTVFADNTIKFYPYFKEDKNGDYREFFVPESLKEPSFPISDSHTVRTNPLLFGTEPKPLLSLSAHPGSTGSQSRDETDEFDPRFRLREIFILVSTPEQNQDKHEGVLMQFPTVNLPKSAFQLAQEGNARTMLLQFRDAKFGFGGDKPSVAGNAIPALAELLNSEYRVSFTVRINAEVNLQDGWEKEADGKLTILSIKDKDGQELSMTEGEGKTVLDTFKLRLHSYNYDNTLSNANRRSRGTLLDNQKEVERLKTTLQSPITMQKPVNGQVAAEEDQVANLILGARLRNNANAGTKLLNYEETLEEVYKGHTNKYEVANIEGVGRWYVHPWYERKVFDADAQTSALQSSDVAGELRSALLVQLRDQVTRAFRDSRMGPALQAYTKYAVSKPKVGILTDPVIHNWLWQTGDQRTLGEGFEFYIDYTYDDRFVDTIRWYFATTPEGFSALHFGAFLWIPELVVTTSMSRDNRIADELTVQPRCEHVVNTPILGRFDVVNMHKYLTGAPSIGVHVQTPLKDAVVKEDIKVA
ncbi:MAG: hypothetical protein ACRDDY_13735 [Clostridium sp.]|uniref:hypothetical protein n=1 Tax=Clostridium sp. TaxID=1506 RepID=UPI003EE5219A